MNGVGWMRQARWQYWGCWTCPFRRIRWICILTANRMSGTSMIPPFWMPDLRTYEPLCQEFESVSFQLNRWLDENRYGVHNTATTQLVAGIATTLFAL